jgi:hypothetical protein
MREIIKTAFKKKPMCEVLRDKPAEHFTCREGRWMFVSTEVEEKPDEYHFRIDDFFKSPRATVDWLAHLHEKGWFDANDFFAMMHRFREETHSYGVL